MLKQKIKECTQFSKAKKTFEVTLFLHGAIKIFVEEAISILGSQIDLF